MQTVIKDGEIIQVPDVNLPELSDADMEALDLSAAQDVKGRECDAYAQSLIDAANANPQQGVTANSAQHARRVEARRKDKADKAAGEIALDQAEKDQAKTDQKLSEYETKVFADSDKAITNMLKLNTATDIYAFDVVAESWTVWTPPL